MMVIFCTGAEWVLSLIHISQTYRNIHFKAPTDSYAAMFDQMIADGVISTRGLKADAMKYGELIFDVNSAYFHNHGGYEYAKQFYTCLLYTSKLSVILKATIMMM